MAINAIDLTKRPPRSPRVRLGGYVMLARMLDKGRAAIAGTNGEYNYACPMDQRLLQFLDVDPEALKKELGSGKSDSEMLQWIRQNGRNKHDDLQIAAWSVSQERRAPSDLESRKIFNELHAAAAPHRDDIVTWFDLLDADDYASFGGKP